MSQASERTAIVVGGGIGGLATAVALLRRGWAVEVIEQAPAFAEVGSGPVGVAQRVAGTRRARTGRGGARQGAGGDRGWPWKSP